jgi:hypothetical protein
MSLLRKYGICLAVLWTVGLYGAASSGCTLSSPSDDAAQSVEQSELTAPAPAVCAPCPLIRHQLTAGLAVDPQCAISCVDCGDGICNNGETHADCPIDCPASGGGGGGGSPPAPVCGNGKCESGENITNCREDCCRAQNPPCTV